METPHTIDEASAAWEWNSLLDFNVDDELTITWSPEHHHHQPIDSHSSHNQNQSTQIVSNEKEDQMNQESDGSDNSKIRKRDPRLTCENFLAGIIPCACPELDEKLEEEERSKLGKKRARTGSLAVVRCQVPECEIDISELKGYHRRHRICLRCANANSLLLDGEYKRYCQQCGKFHILPDFDEGKRSCRWKLERHNNRRRRKSSDSKVTAGKGVQVVDQKKETEGNIPVEDLVCDAEARKDNSQLSVQNVNEAVESEEGRISPGISLPSSQDIRSDSIKSFASGETQKDQGKDNSIFTISSSFGDNRSAYSSVCPTGRISFKLYDWNPAEFPRRLRHQIFQWLANMPVELEGYIRPGCTILTVFIPMPQFMWDKVSGDAVSYIHELVREPESMLYGRGNMSVYLNDMIFRVLKGRASLRNVKVEMRAPRLHYVHPTWFEAGKSVEFIACGSNMIQPKIRFLVSFAGKYLTYSYKFAISHGKPASCHGKEDNIEAGGRDHQMYKIYIPKTEPALWGPAFVEVESELGLSNFIPILLGDAQTCSELQLVQKKLGGSLHSKRHRVSTPDTISKSCKFFESTERAMSDLILDIAWLLKEPKLEDKFFFSSANIQRLNCLLSFLIQNDSIFILEKVLNLIENKMMDKKQPFNPDKITNDADTNLFQNYIVRAREIVHWRIQQNVKIVPLPTSTFSEVCFSQNHSIKLSVAASNNEEMAVEKKLGSMVSPTFQEKSETIPLLDKRTVKDMVQNPSGHNFQSTIRTPRPLVLVVAVAALCSGVCAVVFHPQRVEEFAVTIHHCLFGYSDT